MQHGEFSFEPGLASVSFRRHVPAEIISAAAAAGLRCIEWGGDVHAPPGNAANAREIAERTRDAGLSVCSYGTYFRIGLNTPDELRACFDTARALGTDTLRLWCGACGYARLKSDGAWDRLVGECRAFADMAEAEGAVLSMECHQGTATDDPRGMLELAQAVGSDAFSFHWQPDQFKSVGENLEYARTAAPFAGIVHVFQWKGARRLPLSVGIDEWRGYLADFTGRPRRLLLEFMPHDDIAELPLEADALRTLASGMHH